MRRTAPPTATELASAYHALTADCRALEAAIAADEALDACLEQAEDIGGRMAGLPDPQQLAEADDTRRMNDLRRLLDDLLDAHRAGISALHRRMHRERGQAADDQRRAAALRAYGGGRGEPAPRFHDRRG